MSNNDLMEILKQHRAGQDKYTYFLLAVAASGIGYSVEKTTILRLTWSMIPLGVAVILWGVSFYFGCKTLYWVQTSIRANYSLLQLQRGIHPTQPDHPQKLEAAIKGVETAIDSNINKAVFYDRWQFPFLVAGALFFIAWRITEMVIRTFRL